MHELCYTEAPKGLFPGSAGFCTVKATPGMPLALREKLESLSWYDRKVSDQNFPRFAFSRYPIAGTEWQILTQVSPTIGHSKRASVFAHHIALNPNDARHANPALLLAGGLLECGWDGTVGEIQPRDISQAVIPSEPVGATWQRIKGEPEFAHLMAAHLRDQRTPVVLAWNDAAPLLQLIGEAVSLLPAPLPWQITFSTQYSSASDGNGCRIRGIKYDKKKIAELQRGSALVVDLTRQESVPASAVAAKSSLAAGSTTGFTDTGFGAASGGTAANAPAPLLAVDDDGFGYDLQASPDQFGGTRPRKRSRSGKRRSQTGNGQKVPTAAMGHGGLLDENTGTSGVAPQPSGTNVVTSGSRATNYHWAIYIPTGAVIGAVLAAAICVPMILSYKGSADGLAAKYGGQEEQLARLQEQQKKDAAEAAAALDKLERELRTNKEQGDDLSTELQSSRDSATKLKQSLAEFQNRLLKIAGSKRQVEPNGARDKADAEVTKVFSELESLMKSTGANSFSQAAGQVKLVRDANDKLIKEKEKIPKLERETAELKAYMNSVSDYVVNVDAAPEFPLQKLPRADLDEKTGRKRIELPDAKLWRMLIGKNLESRLTPSLELARVETDDSGGDKKQPHLQFVQPANDSRAGLGTMKVEVTGTAVATLLYRETPVPSLEFSWIDRPEIMLLVADHREALIKAMDGMQLTLTPEGEEVEDGTKITFKMSN